MATRDRTSYCKKAPDRRDGVCSCVAVAGRRLPAGADVQECFGAIERSPNEAYPPLYGTCTAGRPLDPAFDARVARTLQSSRPQTPYHVPYPFTRHRVKMCRYQCPEGEGTWESRAGATAGLSSSGTQ